MPDHPLKVLRQHRGLTQEQAARLAQVSRASVARIEAGGHIEHGASVLKVARGLGVTVNEILNENQSDLAELLDRKSLIACWLGLDPTAPGTDAYLEQVRRDLAVVR
jgi:transcriptional regulator with XRE-family HTH domain